MANRLLTIALVCVFTLIPIKAQSHVSNPHEAIGDDLAEQLAKQLAQVEQPYGMSNIGVTRWVLAETLEQPDEGDSLNQLSYQLSESIYAHLKERNLNLVEFRAQDYVSISERGATALTRNTEALEQHPELDWILVGTLARKDAGTMVNLRVIDRRNQEVLAAANRYVPKHLYWPNKQVELVNGHLQRN
ncbi:FlgO family outer membrane protein [Idiomarina sp. HP20-50]|uniref:FlgO family outer membrane protein n=1 Tax=Idiomarina sp. HP20-50 TaxID=3070813 RepID=UPI00294B6BA2|nr:FlgO family outer membrane protein [Idiomarina sp. HP20-50]MDV6317009.1 FlgO family outer membrane protein [Idiomarina sp. HP20-50]